MCNPSADPVAFAIPRQFIAQILRWLSRRCSSAVSKPLVQNAQNLRLCGLDTPSADASGYSTTFGFERVKWLVFSKIPAFCTSSTYEPRHSRCKAFSVNLNGCCAAKEPERRLAQRPLRGNEMTLIGCMVEKSKISRTPNSIRDADLAENVDSFSVLR
jgi:hypothetical protein